MAPSRSTAVALLASSTLTVCTLRLLQWRARKRAREAAERARRFLNGGPLIDIEDESVKLTILNRAIGRAFKWLSCHASDSSSVKAMEGQVGGISNKRRPVLTMRPDYVMKPLHSDHRGYREVAFYESIRLASQNGAGYGQVAAAIAGREETSIRKGGSLSQQQKTWKESVMGSVDLLAMWMAIFLKDSEVAASEEALVGSWKATKREIDLLGRLSNFTPQYFGVVKDSIGIRDHPDSIPESASAIGDDSYLLLSDVTASYSKPCVMDIKIGQQTYEPDASEDKRTREYTKYPQQATFGFRIVGMRYYEPTHPEANEHGFRYVGKPYGRTLTSREEILNAFRMFFSAGIPEGYEPKPDTKEKETHAAENGQDVPDSTTKIRTHDISNLVTLARRLHGWFDDNRSFCFYASSLLIVYEGDSERQGNTTLKMIDLGHSRREAGGDHGFVFGLQSVISILSELMEGS